MSSSPAGQRPPKRQSRLLPAPDVASSSSTTNTAQQPTFSGPIIDDNQVVPRRPRVGVVVACDRCRVKKIRCDGNRPSCTACARKGLIQCHYDEPSAKSPNSGYLLEAVRLLTSMAPARATAALLAVADFHKDSEIIATLRNMGNSATLQTAYITGPAKGFSRFLERKHPSSYPINEPIDPIEPRKSLNELIEPGSEEQLHNENMPMETVGGDDEDAPSIADPTQGTPTTTPPQPDIPLNGLDISRWTTVPVSDLFAAKAISLYLETDHSFLCLFNQKLFLQSLLSPGSDEHCSPCLVNALLFWCCQSLVAVDQEVIDKAELFRAEAMRLIAVVSKPYTRLQMAAQVFLGLGHLAQGRDVALSHLSNAALIGMNLRLFGVPEDVGWAALSRLTPEEVQASMYPTWGAFNWIVLMSIFYRQQGITYPEYPPVMPIPSPIAGPTEHTNELQDQTTDSKPRQPSSQEQIFKSLCRFWRIMHEAISVYYENQATFVPNSISLQFAEFKYRELLAWADELPPALLRSNDNPHIVLIIHIYLHSAILDIFRPFLRNDVTLESNQYLRTFATTDATPDDAYEASMHQLKQLILESKTNVVSNHNIFWQTALMYAANGMLRSHDEDRLEYFLICLYSFRTARHSFRVTVSIAQAMLSTAMQQGVVSGTLASMIIADLRARAPAGQEAGERPVQAPSMADLDYVMTDPEPLAVEQSAEQFDDSSWIAKYINLFSKGIEEDPTSKSSTV